MSAHRSSHGRRDPAAAVERTASAVLVPLWRDAQGELRVVLIRRAEGGLHGGQLAFPGGRREPTDASDEATALREAREEIGLDPAHVTILAALPPLETRTSRFRIAPFLARIERPDVWTPAFREIAEILEPRIAELTDPAARGETVEHFATWPAPQAVPHIRIGPHRLWGATWRILDALLPRLAAGEWEIP